jgi:small neutral amino acid transporter SnatA (MarC family)
VGGTYLILGTQIQSIVFIAVSVGTLVVSKMVMAWVATNFREFLDSSAYVVVMKFLGLLLAAFGVLFIIRGQNILFG